MPVAYSLCRCGVHPLLALVHWLFNLASFLNHFRPESAHELCKGHTVWLSGDGTREQCEKMHEVVQRTSPNYYNIANPIELTSELFVE